MNQEASQQITPPASPVVKPKSAVAPDKPPLAVALTFGALMAVVYMVLPAIYKAHYDYLFWAEGFVERAYSLSFLTGNLGKLIGIPSPLWNLFWLLGRLPNQLLLLVGLLVGGISALFPLVSWKLSRSALPGILAALLMTFGFKDVLEPMTQGSWIVPYILLGLILVLALYSRRFGWATLAVGLTGLFRPDAWFLAVFLLIYIVFRRERLKWYYFLPLLAPLLWMLYDFRISGDWMFSYRSSVAYAALTGATGSSFVNFWRIVLPQVVSSTGILVLLYALVGIVARARNVAREAKGSKLWAILLDPLLATALVPFVGYWLLSLAGNITVMGRFVALSAAAFALYALLLPYELFRNRPIANRSVVIGAVWLPLLLVGLVRMPTIGRDVHRSLKITESKMAAIEALAETVKKPVADLEQYKFIFVPLQRYAQFSHFLGDELAQKLLSYREVSLAVMSTQAAYAEGYVPEPPRGSPEFLKREIQGEWRLADFLPALALWIPDDAQQYLNTFAFDDPEYFRKNYIDQRRYGFRIIGEALDSLGLVYDCRDLSPEQIRVLPPSDTLEPGPESGDSR